MEVTDPRLRSLLRHANRVAASGKRIAAEKLFRQLLEEEPALAPAWLGLAEVVRDPAEKAVAYQLVLEIDPGNEAALLALAALDSQPELDGQVTLPETPPAALGASVEAAHTRDDEEPVTVEATAETLFCANHPNRATNLRCNRCGKPICTRCARRTPVGYRCRECVHEQQEAFYNATPLHYLLAAIVSFPLGVVGGFLANAIGLWVIFLAAGVGTLMGRIVFRLIGRRRGRWLPHLVAAMLIIGAATPLLFGVVLLAAAGQGGILSFAFGRLIWPLIYAAIAASAAYYQMK